MGKIYLSPSPDTPTAPAAIPWVSRPHVCRLSASHYTSRVPDHYHRLQSSRITNSLTGTVPFDKLTQPTEYNNRKKNTRNAGFLLSSPPHRKEKRGGWGGWKEEARTSGAVAQFSNGFTSGHVLGKNPRPTRVRRGLADPHVKSSPRLTNQEVLLLCSPSRSLILTCVLMQLYHIFSSNTSFARYSVCGGRYCMYGQTHCVLLMCRRACLYSNRNVNDTETRGRYRL